MAEIDAELAQNSSCDKNDGNSKPMLPAPKAAVGETWSRIKENKQRRVKLGKEPFVQAMTD